MLVVKVLGRLEGVVVTVGWLDPTFIPNSFLPGFLLLYRLEMLNTHSPASLAAKGGYET